MSGTIKVGPWSLQRVDPGKLAKTEEPVFVWLRSLLSRLRDPEGNSLTTTTLVTRRTDKPEPSDPDEREHERQALQAAVSFAVADANTQDGNGINWDKPVATGEVSHFFAAQLDLKRGALARMRGGAIFNKLVGGGTVFDDWVLQLAPEGLVELQDQKLDPVLLNAVYEVDHSTWVDNPPTMAEQTSAALHWHSRAWENSPLHTIADVLVQLKTAIEALSGQHKTAAAIPVLEALYAAIDGTLGANDFLWRDNDKRYDNVWNGKTTQVSAFAAWYWNLANIRNDIVHSTKRPHMDYQAQGSPFSGNVFQIAERVTRELIKIRLAQLGYPLVALSQTNRGVLSVADERGVAGQLTLIALLDE